LTRLGAPPDEEALANGKAYSKGISADSSKQNNGYQELLQLIKNQKMFYASSKVGLVINIIELRNLEKYFILILTIFFQKRLTKLGSCFVYFKKLSRIFKI
jgi:hypothetical protein